MKNFLTTIAVIASLAGTATITQADGIAWNMNKNVSCTAGNASHGGITLVRGEVIQMPSALTAATQDISACNGPVIPANIDPHRQSEVRPWLASLGYTDVDVSYTVDVDPVTLVREHVPAYRQDTTWY